MAKIKDCRRWPCTEFNTAGHVDGMHKGDIRAIHGIHEFEATYDGADRSKMIVGFNGMPWKVLIHRGRKP